MILKFRRPVNEIRRLARAWKYAFLAGRALIFHGPGVLGVTGMETPIHDISSDGSTVWVNGSKGLIGRFGLMGIDIHRPLEEVCKGVCLHCTHGPTTRADWDVFVTKMLEHFAIEVPEEHLPERFR